MNNYEAALKAEMRKVVRSLQRYDSETRATHAASHRLGHRKRESIGEYFYTHPAIPEIAFTSRKRAAETALQRSQ